MATVVDEARPSDATKACARSAFTQPTPRTFPRTFTIKASVEDVEIPDNGPPTFPGTIEAATPSVDLDAFWLANVPATWRPA